jgi:hypothetical protein
VQAAASSSKQQQAAASSSKQQQAAASSSKQQQAATVPPFPHHYPFTFILVVVGLFFQKLIMISGNHGSNGNGSLDSTNSRSYFGPRFKRLLWYLIGSTKGGYNRARRVEYLLADNILFACRCRSTELLILIMSCS